MGVFIDFWELVVGHFLPKSVNPVSLFILILCVIIGHFFRIRDLLRAKSYILIILNPLEVVSRYHDRLQVGKKDSC